ncbi:hypothetical protein BC940DRAFT_333530 [Gongronella butleri]|nr:hypothetical protein BC940DRAFT_333530 [Gongronella butleri]
MATEADGGWVAQRLARLDAVAELSRRQRSRLRFHIKRMINDAHMNITFGPAISAPLAAELSNLAFGGILAAAHVQHIPYADRGNEAPIVQMQADAVMFESVLNVYQVKLMQAADAYHHFDHLNVGPVPGLQKIFLNVVRSDEHQIEFIYAKRAAEDAGLPSLDIQDFQGDEDIDIIAVDPGHTHLITAIDDSPEPIKMRLSNREWMVKSGFFIRRQQQQAARANDGIEEILSEVPTGKTASVATWTTHCRAALQAQPALVEHHGYEYANRRFLAYNANQKMKQEAVNMFLGPCKKYPDNEKRRNLPVIAYGAGTFGSMPGKNPKRAILPALRRAEAEGRLCVVLINEAYTSQVCPLCQERSLQPMNVTSSVSGIIEPIWGVKRRSGKDNLALPSSLTPPRPDQPGHFYALLGAVYLRFITN